MADVTAPMALTISATNVAATSAPAYSAGTTYALGDTVSAAVSLPGTTTITHEYESLQAANTGHALNETDWWLDLGPTNRDAMFDAKTGTETSNAGSITITAAPNAYFDTIAVVRISGAVSVEVTVDRGATQLYTNTVDLRQESSSWWEYYFSDLSAVRDSIVLRPEIFFSDATVTVTITGAGTVSCGLLMIGRSDDLGITLQGASISIEDYSTKEVDQFGNSYLLERDYADIANVEMILEAAQTDFVKRKLAAYRATPALYDFNDDGTDYESLIIFGKYDDFSVNMTHNNKSFCSMTAVSIL